MPSQPPKVQIFCTSYKHGSFIRQALESFIRQKTDFPFEVIVADDASPDNTTDIIREYQRQYPDLIKPIFRTQNTGGDLNYREAANRLTAQYVAICEGDDYWIDDKKLQKQVNALDKRPDCAVCFHPVLVKWEDHSRKDCIFPESQYHFNKSELTLEDLLQRNFIQTNSLMYRWRFRDASFLRSFPESILPGDWYLSLLHAETGKILFLDDMMAVYRKWSGGQWIGAGVTDEWFCRCGIKHLRFFTHTKERFSTAQNTISFFQLSRFTWQILKAAERREQADIILDLRKEFLKYALGAKLTPFLLLLMRNSCVRRVYNFFITHNNHG